MHRAPLFCAFGLVSALGVTAALAVLAIPARAAEERYYTLINVDSTKAEFADDNAQRDRDGSIRLTVLSVPDAGAIAYSTRQVMLNCASQKTQMLAGVNFSRDGARSPIEGEAAAGPIKPGTLGAVLKRYICDGVDPYPRSKTIKGLDDALSRARDLIAVEKNK
jgi:hypothetical protein